MNRLALALLVVGMSCLTTLAQQDKLKGAADPIADKLKKAKEDYQQTAKTEIVKMLTAIDKQIDKLPENKKLKVEEFVKLDKRLRAERKAFESDPSTLPQSVLMKGAVAEFRLRVNTAKTKCEAAFDMAAEAYRAKKDLVQAKSIIEEKEKFFKADVASIGAQSIKLFIKASVDGTDTITINQSGAQWGYTLGRPQNITVGDTGWDIAKSLILPNKGATEFLFDKVQDFSKTEVIKIKGRGSVTVMGAKDHFVVTISDPDGGADLYELEIVIKK